MDHIKEINWNYRNNISSALLIERPTNEPSDREYYVYDASGMRVRKITERYMKTNGEFKFLDIEQKIYLDGYEIKQNKRIDLGNSSSSNNLERISCHIMDDKRRIAIVYRWNIDVNNKETDSLTSVKVHYQLGNHLGSCSLEIDDNELIISYEEYYPYGGTSLIAGKSLNSSLAKEVRIKDYRYIGKERDDTTCLYYHGARYYVAWLGRWTSSDPISIAGGVNLYVYAADNPVRLSDLVGYSARPGSG